ncbi:MAG: GNAT family N-acetyltransferase [Planctomycetes bacterium]|nr:GNAT family N-acetyltransferase [Planctomycetota bacterium]
MYVTFLRDLPESAEDCLGMIPRKSRASTRHARDRHQMELVEGHACFDRFYELFVQNKRNLGSPVFARSFFARLLHLYGAEALIHGVRCQGRIVAGVLSFVFRDTLMPYYSGSEEAAERLGSMNFMYWKLMEAGVERGLKRFDFGRSRAGTGASTFKQNMGFEPAPLHYEYYLRRGAEIPSVNPSNPRFDGVKRLWRRLPLPLVRLLGPPLMKYLP